MYKTLALSSAIAVVALACMKQPENAVAENVAKQTYELLGYSSQVAWGEHLVAAMGCDDCHSTKIMTDRGPVPDPASRLSGHIAGQPAAQVDRHVIEANGYGACNSSMTAWTGPWGISYAANLTSDPTGIGNWTEENFSRALREGKFKGLESGRMLLPPMPWQNYTHLTDDEVSAIFAYLKTVPPVKNVVPNPEPPATVAAM